MKKFYNLGAWYRTFNTYACLMLNNVIRSLVSLDSPRQRISRLAVQRHLQKGPEWSNYIHETERTQLEYKYRVMCNPEYYGPGCSVLCKPRDDKYGHYRCNENGEIICLDGWTGQYCTEGKGQSRPYLPLPADHICNQFGPRLGPTERRT